MAKFNCPKCNETNPEMFYKSSRNASYCKRCHKDAVYRMRLRRQRIAD